MLTGKNTRAAVPGLCVESLMTDVLLICTFVAAPASSSAGTSLAAVPDLLWLPVQPVISSAGHQAAFEDPLP